jgi:hypothetical protein
LLREGSNNLLELVDLILEMANENVSFRHLSFQVLDDSIPPAEFLESIGQLALQLAQGGHEKARRLLLLLGGRRLAPAAAAEQRQGGTRARPVLPLLGTRDFLLSARLLHSSLLC